MKTIEKIWHKLTNAFIDYLPHLINALVIIGCGFLIAFILVRIARKIMTRHHVDPSLMAFVERTIRFLVYIYAALTALTALQISVTGIIALFSAAAAAIAIALKDRLNDIASGIIILFTKPFVTGDFIEFGDHRGFVQKVDIMHTNILTYDGTNVIIPNSVISNAEVNNYTAHPQIRVTIVVPVPYDSNIEQVKTVLTNVIDSTDLVLSGKEYPHKVRLERFGDSALEFTVRCYCEYKDYWTVYYALMEGIKNTLDENGISIPFNQLDVHMVKD